MRTLTKLGFLIMALPLAFNPLYADPRFSMECESDAPIVYYFSQPILEKTYPILILCEGSSGPGNIGSVLFIRNYFSEKMAPLGAGYLTLEKRGIDGDQIDEETFWKHYSRSQRLADHLKVMKHIQENPPLGWNGKWILMGVSEGGALVTDLSTFCPNVIATVNWVGAGDWPWADQLWRFFENEKVRPPDLPKSREAFDVLLQEIIASPTPKRFFVGMTYLYHADALQKAPIDYHKIYSPFLVVEGTEDSTIDSCDAFVRNAQQAGAPITYFRIEGMGHYIRHHPDVIERSFDWLKAQLLKSSEF